MQNLKFNSVVVGAPQTFEIFRQKICFLKTMELCVNFCMGFFFT